MENGEYSTPKWIANGSKRTLHVLGSNMESNPHMVNRTMSHAKMLLDSFYNAFRERRFTDITLRCDSHVISVAHRVVLAAFSINFDTILRDVRNVAVNLDLDSQAIGVSSDQLVAMLHFMYTGLLSNSSLSMALRAVGCADIVSAIASDGAYLDVHEHADYFRRALARFYAKGLYVDCTLHFPDGESIKTHRIALCSFSTIFDAAFRQQPQRAHIVVDVDSLCSCVTSQDMRIILDFIYTGRVCAMRRRFLSLRDVSCRLGVSTLVRFLDNMIGRVTHCSEDEAYKFDEIVAPNSVSRIAISDLDDKDMDYSVVYDAYINGPERGKKLFSKKPSSRFVHTTNDEVSDAWPSDDCELATTSKRELLDDVKPFKCPFCEHRTKERSAIEKHVRCMHTHEAPYRCGYCKKGFKVQSNFVRHTRIHTGEKPYVCKKCGTTYADKKNMDAHVYRQHLQQQPHFCVHNGCNAKFWRKDRLEIHLTKKHGENLIR